MLHGTRERTSNSLVMPTMHSAVSISVQSPQLLQETGCNDE